MHIPRYDSSLLCNTVAAHCSYPDHLFIFLVEVTTTCKKNKEGGLGTRAIHHVVTLSLCLQFLSQEHTGQYYHTQIPSPTTPCGSLVFWNVLVIVVWISRDSMRVHISLHASYREASLSCRLTAEGFYITIGDSHLDIAYLRVCRCWWQSITSVTALYRKWHPTSSTPQYTYIYGSKVITSIGQFIAHHFSLFCIPVF